MWRAPSLYSGGLHASLKGFRLRVERTPSKNTMRHHGDITSARRALCTASPLGIIGPDGSQKRSEEHTSELQSQSNLVCRLLLEKKKTYKQLYDTIDIYRYKLLRYVI